MLLSIIIPVYNTPVVYLKECVESLKYVYLQKHEYEIIIVDDGSTKKSTQDFINSKKEEYIVVYKNNGGSSSARNKGIETARGTYIYPLDSDDKLHIEFNYFLRLLKLNKSIDVLYGNYLIFGSRKGKVVCPKFNRLRLFYDQNLLPACSFYKKQVWQEIGGYDESFETLEDWDFWVRLCVAGFSFKQIEKNAYCYRIVNDGKSLFQRKSALNEHYKGLIRQKIPKLKLTQNELDEFAWQYIDGDNNKNKSQIFINEKLINTIRKKKRRAVAILIYTYAPVLYRLLTKVGLFRFQESFIKT